MNDASSTALSERWLAKASQRGFDEGMTVALECSGLASEWEALDAGAGLLDRGHRRFIEATGEERGDFLHGQVTADVRGLGDGEGAAACVLTAQGKALGLFSIFAEPERMLLATDAAASSTVHEALERFLVADDVEFEHLEPRPTFALAGPKAAEFLEAAGLENLPKPSSWGVVRGAFEGTALLVFGRDDWRVPVFEITTVEEEGVLDGLLDKLEALGAVLVGRSAEEILRVESGTVRFGKDIDESRLVVEARLEWAIHFAKGCYVGQEVVERAVSRGRLNRELALISVDSEALRVGDPVVGGSATELVTSIAKSPKLGSIALAYLGKNLAAEAGANLKVQTQAGDVAATVLAWPRLRRLAGRDG